MSGWYLRPVLGFVAFSLQLNSGLSNLCVALPQDLEFPNAVVLNAVIRRLSGPIRVNRFSLRKKKKPLRIVLPKVG